MRVENAPRMPVRRSKIRSAIRCAVARRPFSVVGQALGVSSCWPVCDVEKFERDGSPGRRGLDSPTTMKSERAPASPRSGSAVPASGRVTRSARSSGLKRPLQPQIVGHDRADVGRAAFCLATKRHDRDRHRIAHALRDVEPQLRLARVRRPEQADGSSRSCNPRGRDGASQDSCSRAYSVGLKTMTSRRSNARGSRGAGKGDERYTALATDSRTAWSPLQSPSLTSMHRSARRLRDVQACTRDRPAPTAAGSSCARWSAPASARYSSITPECGDCLALFLVCRKARRNSASRAAFCSASRRRLPAACAAAPLRFALPCDASALRWPRARLALRFRPQPASPRRALLPPAPRRASQLRLLARCLGRALALRVGCCARRAPGSLCGVVHGLRLGCRPGRLRRCGAGTLASRGLGAAAARADGAGRSS